jgi:uncharacterized glyoxalase superfamily protein PhnB
MTTLTTYPLITVKDLASSRDFFTTHFGMGVVFQASWVVMLSSAANGTICLGLMTADHPSKPPGPEVFDGRGMIVTMQVENAGDMHERLAESGAPIVYALTDEPWGQRRFMTRDPSGILVDVVEQIEPEPGFWDKYLE